MRVKENEEKQLCSLPFRKKEAILLLLTQVLQKELSSYLLQMGNERIGQMDAAMKILLGLKSVMR